MASHLQLPRGSWLPSHTLPVINIDRLSMDEVVRALVIQEIALACRKQGCFQVSASCLLLLCPPKHLLLAMALNPSCTWKKTTMHVHFMLMQPDQLAYNDC